MTDARAFRGFRFPAKVILWAVGGTCSSRSATATSSACWPIAGSRWTTPPCTARSSASPPSSRSARAGISGRAAGRGMSMRPTSESTVSGAIYRAVDGTGQTIDFLLSAKRDKQAAKRFFRKALGRDNTRNPREIVTDRLKSYPGALREMKRDGELWRFTRHRRGRWLNNLVEQDHRRIKRRTGPMLGFQSFGPRGGRWPASRRWRCWPRDRCVPCPPTTCRRSGPSSTRCSASRSDRKAAGPSSPATSQRNGTPADVARQPLADSCNGADGGQRASYYLPRATPNYRRNAMATVSIISNDGALDFASAVLEVAATNQEYNQPALRIRQASARGGAASIRIDDPNPDIEFVETDQVAPAGKYEIAVQSDKLQINGRNASDNGFETIVVFQRLAAGGNIGFRATSQFGGGQGVIAIANASVIPTVNPAGGGVLYVENGALKYRGSNGTVTTIAPP